MRKDIRNNDRVMIDDPGIADDVWERLQPFFPERVQFWVPVGLNERWRFYRYDPRAAVRLALRRRVRAVAGERSAFTFMIYLNGGVAAGRPSST
jgi:hypothetical protein